MKAKMTAATRILDGVNPRALYIGDVIEGPDAEVMVAAGYATELADEPAEAEPAEPS